VVEARTGTNKSLGNLEPLILLERIEHPSFAVTVHTTVVQERILYTLVNKVVTGPSDWRRCSASLLYASEYCRERIVRPDGWNIHVPGNLDQLIPGESRVVPTVNLFVPYDVPTKLRAGCILNTKNVPDRCRNSNRCICVRLGDCLSG
jgi:hypothetical protein